MTKMKVPTNVKMLKLHKFFFLNKQVNVGNIKAYIGDLQYKEDVNTLAFVVGALAAALATAIVIGVSAVVILRKKKRKAIKEFKMELMTREETIRKASREGKVFI